MDKKRICFIRAKQKNDYVVSGIQRSGYRVEIPYKDYNLILRICREIWFRLKFPHREIWANPNVRAIDEEIIIVKDPLIVPEFIIYLRSIYPNKKIIMDYDNRIANSINPDLIRDYVNTIWHYDEDDCEKFDLKLKGNGYLDVYQVREKTSSEYDVFYVGRDKGRITQMIEIEKNMQQVGLKTYFYICADREFLVWKNKRYKHFLPYEDYLELLKRSRAVLNIVPQGQQSITQREMEAVFDNVKCITNNKGIKKFGLFDESRYFVLDNNYDDIIEFLNIPFKPVSDEELLEYRFDFIVNKMVGESE